MDLDLNQEPVDSLHTELVTLGSLLHELQNAEENIEGHLRQLEAITTRGRQRRRWRQAQNAHIMPNISGETASVTAQNGIGMLAGEFGADIQERTFPSGTFGRSTHLIAEALEMDANDQKTRSVEGRFFDCNICLSMPRDPILTCCGHLFCWPCFYQLSYVHSGIKECPVCTGEVTDTSITPIYGNGNGSESPSFDLEQAGLKLPPRPPAHRFERQR